jgi:predicted RNase H-like HicB family nuclease
VIAVHDGKRGQKRLPLDPQYEAPMKYMVVLEQSDEGYAVSVPGLPGCHSQGATEQEALANIGEAIREYLDVVAELNRGKIVREVEIEA